MHTCRRTWQAVREDRIAGVPTDIPARRATLLTAGVSTDVWSDGAPAGQSDWPRAGDQTGGVPRDRRVAGATTLLAAGVMPTGVRSAEASSERCTDTPWAITAVLAFAHPFR